MVFMELNNFAWRGQHLIKHQDSFGNTKYKKKLNTFRTTQVQEQAEIHSSSSTEAKTKKKITANSEKSDDLKYVRNVTAVTSCKKFQDVKANLNTTN